MTATTSSSHSPPGTRYERFVAKLTTAVLDSAGQTEPALRRAVAARRTSDIPAALRSYVDKVAQHAYKVTDDDIAALNRAGYSEDQIFEVTAAAAVGAALARMERGIALLKESAP